MLFRSQSLISGGAGGRVLEVSGGCSVGSDVLYLSRMINQLPLHIHSIGAHSSSKNMARIAPKCILILELFNRFPEKCHIKHF